MLLAVTSGDELLDGGVTLHMDEVQETVPRASAEAVLAKSDNSSLAASKVFADITPDPKSVVVAYKFGSDRELVMLNADVFRQHQFRAVNVTVSESCIAPFSLASVVVRFFDGLDTIIINELAHTFRSRGFLERLEDFGLGAHVTESWVWSKEQVDVSAPAGGSPLLDALAYKMQVMLKACVTFMMVSSITGFFIRVAVNGSAVLMFLIASCGQTCGIRLARVSPRVLTRSFPWIGVHVEVLRRAGRDPGPLFRSHLSFLFFQSFAYLSCNLAWRFIFYRKSSPQDFEEEIFSTCLVLELFNLIFCRTVNSARVFPKLATGSMVFLHFYIFCSLYPLHRGALTVCALTCVYVMVYCVNHFEEPALRADPFAHTTPTAAHPRALYLPQLSPSWTIESAPLWTMFFVPEPPSAYPEEAMRHISAEEYLMP